MGRQLHQKLGDDQRQYHDVTAEIAAARQEVIHDAAVLANHYRSLRAEIQKERAERQAARAEVQHLTEDVQHLRSWLVTVFWTWGLVVAVVGALLAGDDESTHPVAVDRVSRMVERLKHDDDGRGGLGPVGDIPTLGCRRSSFRSMGAQHFSLPAVLRRFARRLARV